MWEEIGKYALGIIGISGIVGSIITMVINYRLNKRMKVHEATLLRQTQENQIKFNQLHLDRVEAIKIIFKNLISLHKKTIQSINLIQTKKQLENSQDLLQELYNEGDNFALESYFYSLYFEDHIHKKIKSIYTILAEAHYNYLEYVMYNSPEDDTFYQRYKGKYEKLKNDVPKLVEEIKNDFQKYLWVEDNLFM